MNINNFGKKKKKTKSVRRFFPAVPKLLPPLGGFPTAFGRQF